MSYYRFSLAWTRILPTGRIDEISQDGVDYYNRVIDNLLATGLKPLVRNFK
jgi:lactase-phlorizin hydrolase